MAQTIVIDRIVKGEPTQKYITASIQSVSGKPYCLLRITNERKKQEQYRCSEFATTFAGTRAFRLEKIDETFYSVFVHVDDAKCGCDCIGAGRYGWCKHIVAIRGLIECGEIPDPVKSSVPETMPAVIPAKPIEQAKKPTCGECGITLNDQCDNLCDGCVSFFQKQLRSA